MQTLLSYYMKSWSIPTWHSQGKTQSATKADVCIHWPHFTVCPFSLMSKQTCQICFPSDKNTLRVLPIFQICIVYKQPSCSQPCRCVATFLPNCNQRNSLKKVEGLLVPHTNTFVVFSKDTNVRLEGSTELNHQLYSRRSELLPLLLPPPYD